MTLDIAGAIRGRLASDETLIAACDQYADASPAIFTEEMPPDYDVTDKPSIIVDEPHIQNDQTDYTQAARESFVRVRIYAKPVNGSKAPLLNVSERTRDLLNLWSSSSFSTGKLDGAIVSGPVPSPTSDPSLGGRLITIRLFIKE